jgi:hypothetical protein
MAFVSNRITSTQFVGALSGTSSYASNAELLDDRDSVEFITTGSVDTSQIITGSLKITQNLDVFGTASFAYTTASQTLVDQNTITVYGSGSILPKAGYIAADTASVYASGSLLYDLPNGYWVSNKPISASRLYGTSSYADVAVGYVHTQDTASTSWLVTHSLNIPFPSVTIWVGDEVALPDTIVKNSVNNLTITFTQPLTGSARIL